MKIISKQLFPSLSLKCVATNRNYSNLQPVQTRSCLYCIMSAVMCVDAGVYLCTYEHPLNQPNQTACSSRPNIHFSSFTLVSLLFSPFAFQPPFVVRKWGGGGGPKTWKAAQCECEACAGAAISQLLFACWSLLVLIKHCCEVNQQGHRASVLSQN